MRRRLLLMIASAGSLAVGLNAQLTTYTYTGNVYTTAQAPYTTSEFIKASFTFASPLGANLPYTNVTSLVQSSWSINDGVVTYNSTNTSSGNLVISVATNAAGIPDIWLFFAEDNAGDSLESEFGSGTGALLGCLVLPDQTISLTLSTDLARLGNSLFPDSATVNVIATPASSSTPPCNAATITQAEVISSGMTAWKKTVQVAANGVTDVSTENSLTPFILSQVTASTLPTTCATTLNNQCPSCSTGAH